MIYTSGIANFFGITDRQLVFIAVVAALIVGAALFLLFFPIRRFINKTKFLYLYYKKVRSIAVDKDYYLVNQYVFNSDDKNKVMIDHILFGNKFIYLITSKYYEGDLVGKQSDASFILIDKKGKRKYTDNPVERSKFLMSRLSMSTGINTILMIGIVLVNDNCKLQIESESKQFYVIQRNRLPALIRAIESRKIGNINSAQLEQLVREISNQNSKNKK